MWGVGNDKEYHECGCGEDDTDCDEWRCGEDDRVCDGGVGRMIGDVVIGCVTNE